jgi:phenylacetate-CoA ligase
MIPPLHPPIVRNIVYPIYRGLRGDALLPMLEELEQSQWLPAGELEELQWRRLHDLLAKAARHVPYYRELLAQAGIGPGGISNPGDFRRIPFLTKNSIREAGKRIITADPTRKGFPSSTGGSTGETLYFFGDAASGPVRRANTLRCYRWAGVDVGDRQAFLWGYSLVRPFRQRLAEGLKHYFNNTIYLSTFDMSDEKMRGYAGILKRYRPSIVIGYPSALELFCRFCAREGLGGIEPAAVVTSGEMLFPGQREAIERFFGCPVFDRYGSREFANVAQECPEHNGLHLFSDLVYAEILDERGEPVGPSQVGELVVTDLMNHYMPFIRYRTGDLAVPSDRVCPCGRGLPLLERIEGRSFDAIVTPDGRSIGGFFWTWLSRAVPGIKRFQIEQRERSGVYFKIVPGPDWREEAREELRAKIRETCGEHFFVEFAIMDEIPLTPSGKSRFIVSNVEDRFVVKSKIHKARITEEIPDEMDCLVVDERLLELANISNGEKVLVVDNTNGARVETFAVKGAREGGRIAACGAASMHLHTGDEVSIMAFAWSDGSTGSFKNILVDERNGFVRYLTEVAGEIL